jgi:hypothetical protein
VTAIATEPAMRSEANRGLHVRAQSRALGLCWMVYGMLRLAMAAVLAIGSATATVMFGALLVRVADPYSLMTVFHLTYMLFILFSLLLGVVGIVAGAALRSGTESSRRLTLFAAILAVSQIPIGTTLGAYTLVVLLQASRRTPTD